MKKLLLIIGISIAMFSCSSGSPSEDLNCECQNLSNSATPVFYEVCGAEIGGGLNINSLTYDERQQRLAPCASFNTHLNN